MAYKCGSRYIVVRRDTTNFREYRSFPLRCKSWSCPECAARKSLKYGKRIEWAFKNQQLYFYTFTFFHDVAPVEGWRRAQSAWNKLNISINKKYGRFPYVKILESHTQSCFPHYHVLSSKLLGAEWLGREAIAAGFGYQIRLQRVNSSGVNGYMRKYLGKSWPNEEASVIRRNLRLRVVTFSRGLATIPSAGAPWKCQNICYNLAYVNHLFALVAYSLKNREVFWSCSGLGAPFPHFGFSLINHPNTNETNWKERLLWCNN